MLVILGAYTLVDGLAKQDLEPLRPSMEKAFLVGLLKSCPPQGRGYGVTSRNLVHRSNRMRMILC
jgi:hypothetical protein